MKTRSIILSLLLMANLSGNAVLSSYSRWSGTGRNEKLTGLIVLNIEPENSTMWQSFKWIIHVFVIVLLSIWLFVVIYRLHLIKQLQAKTALQQKMLRLQMNPHLIFNLLAIIQNLMINNNSDKAVSSLSMFSALLRSILHNSFNETVTIETEMKTLNNYLGLQQMRYVNRFDYSIDIDPSVDAEYNEIPVMLLQPFIENAIEHGIKPKSESGHISINCYRNGSTINIEIQDDGIGREKANEMRMRYEKDHKPLSTSITQERINVLNRKLKQKITMEIVDLKDEHGAAKGTKVVFGVPL